MSPFAFPVTPKMAAARQPSVPPSMCASVAPGTAEACCPASPAAAAAVPKRHGAVGPAGRAPELNGRRGEKGDEERNGGAAAARGRWEWGQPTAAATLLARCLAAGVVSQETLELTCRKAPCFVKFSEMEKMANIQAEISEKKLKAEILQLEKETADIAHPFYLGEKCQILQDMNSHLEAVLKEKRALRKRLIEPRCQDTLPIEVTFHKYLVELLTEAVTFTGNLESHLQTVRSIPQIPNIIKNMDIALTKIELLAMELEELTEQILKWRELQKEVYSDSICNTAELDFGLSLT
ncbi:HAUS augmin-like complex subunit 2 [Phalacrocorax carbo]